MQFDYNYKVGHNVQVKFTNDLPAKAAIQFHITMCLIGGKRIDVLSWEFPAFISSQILSQIIHNLCFVCGGIMQDSTAFQNQLVSFDDFGDDAGQKGTTQSRVGTAKQVIVRKCTDCGHSHT